MELPEAQNRKAPGRKPGQRRRTKLEIARDRAEIVELRLLHRKSITEIAEAVSAKYLEEIVDQEAGTDRDGKVVPHLGFKQIKIELDHSIEDYKDTMAEDIQSKRRELIRQFELLGGMTYREYEKSKAPKIVKTAEERDSQEGGASTMIKEVTEERVVGDPRFLSLTIQCRDKVAELEAAYPPKKTTLTNVDGTEPFQFEGTEEFKRLAALAGELLRPTGIDALKAPEVKP